MCLENCLGTHFQKGLSKEGRLNLNVGRTVRMGWESNVIKSEKEGCFVFSCRHSLLCFLMAVR